MIVVSLLEEIKLIEDFFKDYDLYCKKHLLPSKPYYTNYDTTPFVTILLNEIYDPHISLSNEVTVLKSTQYLINDGIPVQTAKRFGSQIAMVFYKKLSVYFQDKTYGDLCKAPIDILNRYDLIISFTDQ